MAKKQRISDLEKYVVVSIAVFPGIIHLFMAVAQEMPVVGIAFVPLDYFVSLITFLGFFGWYMRVGSMVKRMEVRIVANILINFAAMIFSGVPYAGPFFSLVFSQIFAIRTYFFIEAVQKQDREEAAKLALTVQGGGKVPTKQMVRNYARYTKEEKKVV